MDFECIYELLYIILTLLCFGFNITTTFCLPNFEIIDSCTRQIYNDIIFCKRLNNTIFIFGIILLVYFENSIYTCCCKCCRFIVVEYLIILFVIIQWSLTLGLMKKINENNKTFKCVKIDEEISVKVIFIIFCFFLITLIIRLILGMIKEKFKKITILNIIIFIFEICFTIINLIFLPKKKSYNLDNLNFDIEEQMNNSKEIN